LPQLHIQILSLPLTNFDAFFHHKGGLNYIRNHRVFLGKAILKIEKKMMTRRLSLIVFVSVFATVVFGQDFNRPVPNGFPNYEFRKPGSSSFAGHYLMAPLFPSPQSSIRSLAVFDADGYLDWYAGDGLDVYTNFEYHPIQNVFSFASNANQENVMKFYLMDSGFSLVDSVLPANDYPTDIHEFRILENGNYLITATTLTTEDLSGYVFNGFSAGNAVPVRSFVIQEFANGNLVFDWKSIDHIHPEVYVDDYNFDPNNFDYVHGNAVAEDADGNLLVSMRNANAIYKINRTTGNVIWVLGGNSNQFDFTNDDGFSGQHDVRILANGNITLFDNGNSRSAPKFSRAVEYEMDYVDSTATLVWEYSDESNSYSRAMGSFRVDESGERIIGFGFCNRPASNFIHLNGQDEIVSELLFQDSVVSYRAIMSEFSFELNKPEIFCSNRNNEIVLTAPTGFLSYQWNNGEQTQQISVNEAGTYQVWVNEGIGMIGSELVIITDPTSPCGLASDGIAQNEIDQVIKLNSNTGAFEIQDSGKLTVLNSIGQTILVERVNGFAKIDMSNQSKGGYFIVLETDDYERVTQRFLKF
jgi:hypothetical protein